MPKSLAVILLNYKHLDDTIKCIKALQSCRWGMPINFYIVDNSPESTDISEINKLRNSIQYFPNSRNSGFAKGINFGLKKAILHKKSNEYFLIINPDVLVHKDFPKLLDNFRKSEVAIVAPAIRHIQNKKVMYGLDGYVDWKTAKATHYNHTKINSLVPISSEFVTFACVLVRRKTFKNIGFIDERYFMYCEDVDYCLTVKKNKQKILLDPKVTVEHNTSSSFSKPTQKLPISFVSQIKFINKWLPPYKRIYPYLYHLFSYFYLYLLWTYHYAKNNQQQTNQS